MADPLDQEDRTPRRRGSMSDLYDTDILIWSECQAALLRRRAAGELVNDADIDWSNVAEEIEDVGSNRLHAVESLLVQALRHMLKAEAWPLSRDGPNWRADAIDFRQQAAAVFTPSMRQKIDLARLYRRALRAIPETNDGEPPLPLPDHYDFARNPFASLDADIVFNDVGFNWNDSGTMICALPFAGRYTVGVE